MATDPLRGRDTASSRTVTVLGSAGLVLLLAAVYLYGSREGKLAEMTAVEARLALGAEAGDPVTEVVKDRSSEVYYHVVLSGVPLGWPLQLRCEWRRPGGQVARRNNYETRLIHKSVWPTHCRQAFGPDAPSGEWQVRLLSGDRVLSTSSFVMR